MDLGAAECDLRRRWIAALTQYRFDEAANAVYQFFWGDFCDWYLEMVKLRLEFGEGADLAATTEVADYAAGCV